jgi:tetratricopeptide (TPR) repeat protein
MNTEPSHMLAVISRPLVLAVSLALFAPVAALAQSADPYTEKLQAGDAKSASGNHDGAVADYDAAVADAQTPTQRALALGKKAMVLAQKQDYASAREAADSALSTNAPIEPVAEVTALQALAKCQLHEKNYAGALESMTRAVGLSGVDWAKPELAMIRGDAERGTGKFDAAVASYRSILDMPGVSNEFKGVAWLNIGLTEQYSLKNGANAREAYAKAGELNPGLKAETETHVAKIQ